MPPWVPRWGCCPAALGSAVLSHQGLIIPYLFCTACQSSRSCRVEGEKSFRQEVAKILEESCGSGRFWEIGESSSQFNDLGRLPAGAKLESGWKIIEFRRRGKCAHFWQGRSKYGMWERRIYMPERRKGGCWGSTRWAGSLCRVQPATRREMHETIPRSLPMRAH